MGTWTTWNATSENCTAWRLGSEPKLFVSRCSTMQDGVNDMATSGSADSRHDPMTSTRPVTAGVTARSVGFL